MEPLPSGTLVRLLTVEGLPYRRECLEHLFEVSAATITYAWWAERRHVLQRGVCLVCENVVTAPLDVESFFRAATQEDIERFDQYLVERIDHLDRIRGRLSGDPVDDLQDFG